VGSEILVDGPVVQGLRTCTLLASSRHVILIVVHFDIVGRGSATGGQASGAARTSAGTRKGEPLVTSRFHSAV